MKKRIKAPFEIICVIIKRGKSDKVIEFLKDNGSNFHLTTMAEGTAKSGTLEMFGFGIEEREVVFGLIDKNEIKRTLNLLNRKFKFDISSKGIAFTMPLTSATSVILEMAVKGLSVGGV